MFIYIYHLARPLGHAQTPEKRATYAMRPSTRPYTPHATHYCGSTDDIVKRDYEHHHGQGAKLLRAALQQGIDFWLSRVWVCDGRELEQYIKARKETPRFCPVCCNRPYTPEWGEEIDPRLALLPF